MLNFKQKLEKEFNGFVELKDGRIFYKNEPTKIVLTDNDFNGLGWDELISDLVIIDIYRDIEATDTFNKFFI